MVAAAIRPGQAPTSSLSPGSWAPSPQHEAGTHTGREATEHANTTVLAGGVRTEVLITVVSMHRMDLTDLVVEVESALGETVAVKRLPKAREVSEHEGYVVSADWSAKNPPDEKTARLTLAHIMMGCLSNIDAPCLIEVSIRSCPRAPSGSALGTRRDVSPAVFQASLVRRYMRDPG